MYRQEHQLIKKQQTNAVIVNVLTVHHVVDYHIPRVSINWVTYFISSVLCNYELRKFILFFLSQAPEIRYNCLKRALSWISYYLMPFSPQLAVSGSHLEILPISSQKRTFLLSNLMISRTTIVRCQIQNEKGDSAGLATSCKKVNAKCWAIESSGLTGGAAVEEMSLKTTQQRSVVQVMKTMDVRVHRSNN